MGVEAATTIYSNRSIKPYNRDYVGAVQVLEKSGFSPFTEKEPLNSALNEVFRRFTQEVPGQAESTSSLKNEFLDRNPAIRRSMNLYDALEKTFSPASASGDAPIVDFLNSKMNQSGDSATTRNATTEGGQAEMRGKFYKGFTQLENILSYFGRQPGQLIDTYA